MYWDFSSCALGAALVPVGALSDVDIAEIVVSTGLIVTVVDESR